jgi:hypothetical protein
MNQACGRSAAEGTSWFRRVSTQEDRLFGHPNFADPRDPRFRDIANLDFKSALREAISIEIADRRGDWSIPSDAEIAIEASRVAAGHGVSAPPEPPPAKGPAEATPPSADGIVLRVTIRGQTGDYEVTLNDDGAWACSCPAFRFARANPCRHIQQAEANLEQEESEPPATAAPQVAPSGFRPSTVVAAPQVAAPQVAAPQVAAPQVAAHFPMRNIPMPTGGIMADGTAPPLRTTPQVPAADPWAIPADRAPPAKGTVVPVGGKVTMGRKL